MEHAAPENLDLLLIGNPLLDISVTTSDDALLKKYKLELGQATLASEEQMPIYEELWNLEGRLAIPGGAALNSARSAAHWFNKKYEGGKVAYFGCIGADAKGAALKEYLDNAQVHHRLHEDPETPTGTCACVIVDKERSLCANIAASAKYPTDHLNAHIAYLQHAKMIYTTGFFITSNSEALRQVGRYAAEHDKPMGFNLSAVFLLHIAKDDILFAIEHADYVFCNEDEASAYAELVAGLDPKDRVGAAKHLAKSQKANGKRQRRVIFTQGPEPVILATSQEDGSEPIIELIDVPAVANDSIVDTNGAGDAFVGAFLSSLVRGVSVNEAITHGITLSGEVVQRDGCTFNTL